MTNNLWKVTCQVPEGDGTRPLDIAVIADTPDLAREYAQAALEASGYRGAIAVSCKELVRTKDPEL